MSNDLAEKLKSYNFRDVKGNPLEMCNEYQRLVDEHRTLEKFATSTVEVLMCVPFGLNAQLDNFRRELVTTLKEWRAKEIHLIEKNNG